jgi:predicted MFS family arabinose efflux permease
MSASAFRARYFGLVWFSGLMWHMCRWGVAFLGTYLLNDLTGSPRLVQLAGTTLYAPLLVGGVIGGVISDRWNRLATVRSQMLLLAPLAVGIGLLVRSDNISLWMIYVFMFIVGLGWVSDMTSRRALVFDLVGPDRLDNAMAMESLSLSLGMVLGALVGGYAIEVVGVGSSYFVVAALSLAGFSALLPVQQPPRRITQSASPVRDLVDGLQMAKRNRALLSVLGVTVLANFFQFNYFPIIPALAEDLGAAPFFVGLLAAGTGIGMMAGSLLFARVRPRQRGRAYIGGVSLGLVFLLPFALADTYSLALGAIILSGFGSGLFASTQSTLVMNAVPEDMRGRALGLLTMAIGALPLGMYALGELAEQVGVATAIVCSSVAGLVTLATWTRYRPEVLSMT